MDKLQTLKGFRDFLPQQAKKRQYVLTTLKRVFESYGFEPLETPVLEYEEILLGKYGEEGDKLMYRFTDNGGRNVAMRYDQTVPLARVVAQYQQELPFPFKRYQIQPVFRAENTQKGRFREFLQCDIDTVGTESTLSDAEILAVAYTSCKNLGFKNINILVNDRRGFSELFKQQVLKEEELAPILRAVDKLKKIGHEAVLDEIKKLNTDTERAKLILQKIELQPKTESLQNIIEQTKQLDVPDGAIVFDPTLARGLDYYTGLIFEVELEGYEAGSVCGGGRYDKLIGIFAGKDIPAVGCAFGFDRILDAMEEQGLLKNIAGAATVLVTVFGREFTEKSMETASFLREKNVPTELWLDSDAKMDKQLKYADKKGIPYVVVIGPEEVEKNVVTLRNMKTREQKQVSVEKLLDEIK